MDQGTIHACLLRLLILNAGFKQVNEIVGSFGSNSEGEPKRCKSIMGVTYVDVHGLVKKPACAACYDMVGCNHAMIEMASTRLTSVLERPYRVCIVSFSADCGSWVRGMKSKST